MKQTLKTVIESLGKEEHLTRQTCVMNNSTKGDTVNVPAPFSGYGLTVSKEAIDGEKLGNLLVELIESYSNTSGNELIIATSSKLATVWTSGSYGLSTASGVHSILLYEKNSEQDCLLELRTNLYSRGDNSGEKGEKAAIGRNHIVIGTESEGKIKRGVFYTAVRIEDLMKQVYEAAFHKPFELPLEDEQEILNVDNPKYRLVKKIGGKNEDYFHIRLSVEKKGVDLDPDDWDTRYVEVTKLFDIPELNKSFIINKDGELRGPDKMKNGYLANIIGHIRQARTTIFPCSKGLLPAEVVKYAGQVGRALNGKVYYDFVMPKEICEKVTDGSKSAQEEFETIMRSQLVFETMKCQLFAYNLDNDK